MDAPSDGTPQRRWSGRSAAAFTTYADELEHIAVEVGDDLHL